MERIEANDNPTGVWEPSRTIKPHEMKLAEPTLAAARGAGVTKVVIGPTTWLWRPSSPISDQPPPVPNESPAIWDLVVADMQERDRTGRERYGTPLQANNGRDPLVDAYQEALDLVVYLRQAIEERR